MPGDWAAEASGSMPSPPVAEEVPEAVLEQWRQYHESERQWALRRRFILRHLRGYPGAAIDQLLALSVLWANHVFMGCRSVGPGGPEGMGRGLRGREGVLR